MPSRARSISTLITSIIHPDDIIDLSHQRYKAQTHTPPVRQSGIERPPISTKSCTGSSIIATPPVSSSSHTIVTPGQLSTELYSKPSTPLSRLSSRPSTSTPTIIHPDDIVDLSHQLHKAQTQTLPVRQNGTKRPPISTQSHVSSSSTAITPPVSSSSSTAVTPPASVYNQSLHKRKGSKGINIKSTLKDQLLKPTRNPNLILVKPRPASRVICKWDNCSKYIIPTTKDIKAHMLDEHILELSQNNLYVCRWKHYDLVDKPCLKEIAYNNFFYHLGTHLHREGQPSPYWKVSDCCQTTYIIGEMVEHSSECSRLIVASGKPIPVVPLEPIFAESDSKITCKWDDCNDLIEATKGALKIHLNIKHLGKSGKGFWYEESITCLWKRHDINEPCLVRLSGKGLMNHLKSHLHHEGQPSPFTKKSSCCKRVYLPCRYALMHYPSCVYFEMNTYVV